MATIPPPSRLYESDDEIDYPTGDGRPVAETPIHYINLSTAVQVLDRYFAHDPMVYTWGNMFVYYEKGNRGKHVSPDVFVAVGVPKNEPRDAYFTWKEGHGLDLVIELTSKSTKDEDLKEKMAIYRDKIEVREYFLFDPKDEYLDPPLQGYRLRNGQYFSIDMIDGRLPSEVLGLHLERDGSWLRFYSPATGAWLPTAAERETVLEAERSRAELARTHADAERKRAEADRKRAEAERERETAARQRAESDRERLAEELRGSQSELERLRQELERLRRP